MSGSIEMPGNISIVLLPVVSDSTRQEGKISPWSRFTPAGLAVSARGVIHDEFSDPSCLSQAYAADLRQASSSAVTTRSTEPNLINNR